jgi:hypothetical protein
MAGINGRDNTRRIKKGSVFGPFLCFYERLKSETVYYF